MTTAMLHSTIRYRLPETVDVAAALQIREAADRAREAEQHFRIEWDDVTAADLGALQLLAPISIEQEGFDEWLRGWLRLAD